MDTTNHNNIEYSAKQNAQIFYCFAPEDRVRGAYFDVEKILLTILQTNNRGDVGYSKDKGEKPQIMRKREGFCKEKEKLFARLRGSPPSTNNKIAQNLRETHSEFSGFVVLPAYPLLRGEGRKRCYPERRCLCLV